MTPPVLVTGATGRTGGAVVDALRGHAPIRAASRGATPVEGSEPVRFDYADPLTHAAALDGVERMFVLAPPGVPNGQVTAFLDAAVAAGVRRVVLQSVRGAEKSRILPHRRVEDAVRERPFAWIMLRPADYMQNLADVHRAAIGERNEIAVPAGTGRSPFVDVADVGAVGALALLEGGHEGKGYALTGPHDLTFTEVAATLSDVLGRPIRYRSPSVPRFVWEQVSRYDRPLPMALVMSALYTTQRLGRAGGVTNEVRRLLGRPATPLRTFVERERAAWE